MGNTTLQVSEYRRVPSPYFRYNISARILSEVGNSVCFSNSHFPSRNYELRVARNAISHSETGNYEFPSPVERSIITMRTASIQHSQQYTVIHNTRQLLQCTATDGASNRQFHSNDDKSRLVSLLSAVHVHCSFVESANSGQKFIQSWI